MLQQDEFAFKYIDIDKIQPDENNIRTNLTNIEGLADSFRQHGQLQPIIVHPLNEPSGVYRIIAGHRRYAAAQMVGLKQIQAFIKEIETNQSIQLVENIQREDLSAIDIALALQQQHEKETDIDKLGHQLGKSAKWIKRFLALLKHDKKLVQAIRRNQLGIAQAEEVIKTAKTRTIDEAIDLAKHMKDKTVSTRQAAQDLIGHNVALAGLHINHKSPQHHLKLIVLRQLDDTIKNQIENKIKEINDLLETAA